MSTIKGKASNREVWTNTFPSDPSFLEMKSLTRTIGDIAEQPWKV